MQDSFKLITLFVSMAIGSACGGGSKSPECGAGTTLVDGVCTAGGAGILVCGEGTYEAAGVCSPFDPSDDQAPVTAYTPTNTATRDALVDVHLVTEPGARIYYTTDGSEPSESSASEPEDVLLPHVDISSPVTLKFYAADAKGNKESVQSVTFAQDIVGPGPVTNFLVTKESDGTLTLSWTNPTDTDFAGVVIVPDSAVFGGQDGIATAGTDAMYVGAGTSVSDNPGAGYFQYRAIPFDALNNYGVEALGSNLPAFVGSTGWSFKSDGSLVAGTTSTGVVISVTPGTAPSSFEVSVTNNTVATFHAPKVLFKNIVDGSWGDGSVGGETYVRVGAGGVSLVPGATLRGMFTVAFSGGGSGVLASTADLEFRHDALIVVGDERNSSGPLAFIDESTFSEIGLMVEDSYIPPPASGNNGMQGIVSRLGGRFLWSGNRSKGSLRKIDSATWTTVAVAAVGQNFEYLSTPVFGHDGLIWVPLSTAGPAYRQSDRSGRNIGTFLVAVDPDTMSEVRRIAVSTTGRLREAQLIPGSSTIVIARHGGGALYLVDTTQGAATPVQTISGSKIVAGHSLALSRDGAFAVLAGNDDGADAGDVSIVELSTGTVTRSVGLVSAYTQAIAVDFLGRIWIVGKGSALTIVDEWGDGTVSVARGVVGKSMLMVGDKAYVADGKFLSELDVNQQELRSAPLTNNTTGHLLDFVR